MKGDKAISFKAEMAQAVFEGKKTETRRPVAGVEADDDLSWDGKVLRVGRAVHMVLPRYRIGDRVRVKEPYRLWLMFDGAPAPKAYVGSVDRLLRMGVDYSVEYAGDQQLVSESGWRQTRFMNDIFSRTRLRVTDVRLERLQQLDEAGARREGFAPDGGRTGSLMDPPDDDGVTALEAFRGFWDFEIYDKEDDAPLRWEANPWVWVFAFERIESEEKHGE